MPVLNINTNANLLEILSSINSGIEREYLLEPSLKISRLQEIIQYAEIRKLTPPDPYIVYYDKNSGKITRVKGKGFVDDLLGMELFYPQLGIFNEKMISYIWPFELLEYIEECKEKGREVNSQLLALSKKIKPEDNPILILVHLK